MRWWASWSGMSTTCFGIVVFAAMVATPLGSRAAVLDITFSGTYNTNGVTIFGTNGSAVPYSYSILYDSSYAPTVYAQNYVEYPADPMNDQGPVVFGQTMYGFSRSGVLSTSLTVGSGADAETFPLPGSIGNDFNGVPGDSSDLFFNTNIDDLVTPTELDIAIVNGSDGSQLELGGVVGIGDLENDETESLFLAPLSAGSLADPFDNEASFNSGTITLTVVPEPASIALIGLGSGGLLLRPKRQRGN